MNFSKKYFFAFFASILMCLALNVRAQQQQQTDSTPVTSAWIQTNSPSHSVVAVEYFSPDTCWAITSDSTGLIISIDGGLNWNWMLPTPAGEAIFFNAHFGYCFGKYTYRTTNAGVTWDSVGPELPTIINGSLNDAAFGDSTHIFTCGTNDLSRSTDGGQTWNDVGGGSTTYTVSALNTQIAYGVGDPVLLNGSSVLITSNGGVTWTQQPDSIVAGLQGVAVINPNTAIACGSGIFKTTNAGNSWKRVLFVPFQGFTQVTMNVANGFAVGTVGSIYRTTDTGNTWFQENLPVNQSFYWVAMYDDSMGAISNSNGQILIRRPDLASVNHPTMDSLSISSFPDPAQNTITFSYSLPESQHMSFLIYDANGNLILTVLQSVSQSAGEQTVPVSTSTLSSGSYYYALTSESYQASGSFIVIHA